MCPPTVDDHHNPGRCRCPLYDLNSRTGAASSNRTAHTSASGRRSSDPPVSMYPTSKPTRGGPDTPPGTTPNALSTSC